LSAKGKEYELAIRISGVVDKSFNTALIGASAELKTFNATISAMDKNFKELDKGFKSIMSAGEKCFSAIATGATVASGVIGAATAASIAVGSEFESAFAGVKKTVDATDDEYAKLRQDILDMSEVMPSSASEIAGVMEIAGQLGIATDSLTDFTETMINMGVSTNLAAEDAATELARFANVTNMANYGSDGISNYERLGSTIVDLGNNYATTEAEIVDMATNLAATGDIVGLSQAQILGLSTAMSSVGINAEKGGTAMSKLLKKIQLAVETNGKTLSDYASIADMSVSEFSDLFQNDAMSATAAFIQGLNDTERNGKSAVAVLNDMGLSEVRLSDTILRLANAQGELTQEQIDSAIAEGIFEDTTLDTTYSSSLLGDALKTANEAWEENTALATEAGKRYETTKSQLEVLRNNVEQLGITAYDDLREPFLNTVSDINASVLNLNDYLGSADGVSKWIQNINTKLPTMQRKIKSAWKDISPFFDGLLSVGNWFLKNPQVIISGIAGIGTALATYKIASSAVHATKAITDLFKMNPATLEIMGTVAAIGVLTTAITAYEQHEQKLVNNNLADHFGNLALSMQDIQEVAQYILNSDSLSGVEEALDGFGELEELSSEMSDAISEINKMDWKVSIGMELTEDEQESYKTAIDDYISSAQDYVLQNQYAVSLNLSTVSGLDSDISDKINQFYSDSYDEMSSLGEELAGTVNEAFSDKILDPDEIASISEIQAKMAELQESLAESEFEAQLSLIGMKYSGGELTSDSFQDLQEELNTQLDTMVEDYDDSYVKNTSSVWSAYKGGSLTEDEYNKALEELQSDYLDKISGAAAQAASFQLDTIMDQYSGDISDELSGLFSGDGSWLTDQLTYTNEQIAAGYDPLYGMDYDNLEDYWLGLVQDFQNDWSFKTTRDAIAKLMESMEPTVEQLENLKAQYEEAGKSVPESITAGLEQADILSGVANGDPDSILKYIGTMISGTDDEETIKALKEAGRYVPDSIIEGMEEGSDDESFLSAAQKLYSDTQSAIDEYFTQGFSTSADVNITLNPSLSGLSSFSQYGSSSLIIPNKRAAGGLATSPELTWFAENGPEMAIPIDGSSNAISLWENTGRLLGMDSKLDSLELDGGSSSTSVEYRPTLQFYGDAPSKEDLTDALKVSQDEFESLMEKYLKTHGRVSFA
jgi:TP901 family phage tail tape measure protein